MRRTISLGFLSFALMLSNVSTADAPELLIPVTGEEAKRIIAANEYFIKKEEYFAKRHRIVRVKTDLLFGDEENLTLSLFNDVSIPIKRKEIEVLDGGINFTWYGQYAVTPFTVDEFVQSNAHLREEIARRVYGNLFDIRISGTKYVFTDDPATAEGLAGMRRDS